MHHLLSPEAERRGHFRSTLSGSSDYLQAVSSRYPSDLGRTFAKVNPFRRQNLLSQFNFVYSLQTFPGYMC